jgi:hypothetical protein
MDISEMGWEDMELIDLVEDRDTWRTLLDVATDFVI